MSDALAWLDARVAARGGAAARRPYGGRVVDLTGDDYLGLSTHPDVVAAASGTATPGALGTALADLAGHEAALPFSTGYLAYLGAVSALAGRGDVVVADAYAPAALVDACRVSGARVVVTAHGDVDAVDRALNLRPGERGLVVSDGEGAPLAALLDVARTRGATLVLDATYALGLGPVAAGLAGEPDVLLTASLSAALGGRGGAVLGSRRAVEQLAGGGLPPGRAAAALAAVRVLGGDPDLAEPARRGAAAVEAGARAAGLPVADRYGAVVAVPFVASDAALAAGATLLGHGVRVAVLRPPGVPDGAARLRAVARADLTAGDLDRVRAALAALARDKSWHS